MSGYGLSPEAAAAVAAGEERVCDCGAKLWAAALHCPLCGRKEGGSLGEQPVPLLPWDSWQREREDLQQRLDEAQRISESERDLRASAEQKRHAETARSNDRISALIASNDALKAEGQQQARIAAEAHADLTRLTAEVARLKSWYGGGRVFPMLAALAFGALLSPALLSLLSAPAAGSKITTIMLDEQWQRLDIPPDAEVALSADAAMRLRADDRLLAVPVGESVRIDRTAQTLEARAVSGTTELTLQLSPRE